MNYVRQQLLDMIEDPDSAYDQNPDELLPLQLQAAQELFSLRRKQIPLLGRRADDASIKEIRSLDDLVPLLFPHTALYYGFVLSYLSRQSGWTPYPALGFKPVR